MKKYLNIKTFAVITAAAAMIMALVVGNISAFLGWFCAFIYSLGNALREETV